MQTQSLSALPLCKEAYITSIAIQGDLRRRLFDLGFLQGSRVTALFRSPLGDPTAYQIRDTVIALRREDADRISIAPAVKEAP